MLDAWREGGSLYAWCDHERRWHQHGGREKGRRSAQCTCPSSPYQAAGYQLSITGWLTPEVIAGHHEHVSCADCAADGECSCAEPACDGSGYYCGGHCARHAHDDCGGCWRAHGGPGYGSCRQHGILKMHVHAYAKWCEVPYLAADEENQEPCELAGDITRYWPAPGQAAGVHVHCPMCAASSLTWRAETAALLRLHPATAAYAPEAMTRPQPLCPGCRKLITPAWTRWLAAQMRRWEVMA